MKHLLFVVSFLSMTIMSFGLDLKTVCEWKYVDYQWNSAQEKQKAINSGNYNASSCILYDVDKAPDGRLFVTSVREKGVPASVMTVTNQMEDGGPLLSPYPDWSWYKNDSDVNKCINSITSVYRMYIQDNFLFLLDCGKIGDDQICPAQLLVFDLSTDQLFKRIIIPHNVANNKNGTGLLTTLTVFVPECNDINDAIVLISDTTGYGLVVCDMHTSNCCRIESNYMKPTDIIFNIENQTFILYDGILGETLIHEKLYYAPLSGNKIYKMTIPQQSECLLSNKEVDNITKSAGRLSGQTGPIASHDRVIFFSNIPETSILCADTSKEINSNSEIIVQDSEKLQFPSGMKVTHKFHQLMVLTNRYQDVITNTLNLSETNFRILSINLEEIRNKTNCFVSCNKKEKHKNRCPTPPNKTKPKDGPQKGHKPGDGPPIDHNGKPEGGLAKDHNNKSGERFSKDDTDKPGNKTPKDHKPGGGPPEGCEGKPGNEPPKDTTNKFGDEFPKDYND